MSKSPEAHGVIHYVPILDPESAQEYADEVISLSHLWVTRDRYFHTFGAVSYLEAFDEKGVLPFNQLYRYHSHRELINPVFLRHFAELYLELKDALSIHLGTPCEIPAELAHPGFHIFGATKSEAQMEQSYIDAFEGDSWSHLHVDIQYLPHQPFWDKFQHVDLLNPMTFTMSLELPKAGSALRHWHSIESPIEAQHFNYKPIEERRNMIGPEHYAKYSAGTLTYFIGHLIHQVPATKPLHIADRRITLQGHGIKCDNTWQLYF
jgi:hypothetical protein